MNAKLAITIAVAVLTAAANIVKAIADEQK